MDFLSVLNHIFDNPPRYREHRRMNKGNQLDIINPSLNILAGTQPAYLAELLPEYAWGQGFTSRLIMVYSAQEIIVDLFSASEPDHALRKRLAERLAKITQDSFGRMDFTPEAQALIRAWQASRYEPVPTHSRLTNYNPRRILHVLKLCMIAAVSRGSKFIDVEDFNRARDWLIEAETFMPDIFRDMAGKSDRMVLDDLHSAMFALYTRNGGQPIQEGRMFDFLRTKVPSEKILKIVEVSVRSGLIMEVAGKPGYYTPAPLDGIQGLE